MEPKADIFKAFLMTKVIVLFGFIPCDMKSYLKQIYLQHSVDLYAYLKDLLCLPKHKETKIYLTKFHCYFLSLYFYIPKKKDLL